MTSVLDTDTDLALMSGHPSFDIRSSLNERSSRRYLASPGFLHQRRSTPVPTGSTQGRRHSTRHALTTHN
jgi:hypothetical protein